MTEPEPSVRLELTGATLQQIKEIMQRAFGGVAWEPATMGTISCHPRPGMTATVIAIEMEEKE